MTGGGGGHPVGWWNEVARCESVSLTDSTPCRTDKQSGVTVTVDSASSMTRSLLRSLMALVSDPDCLVALAMIGLAGCAPHCASVQYVATPDGVTTTYIKTGCLAPSKATYARLPDGSFMPLQGFDSANPAAPLFGAAEGLIP